MRLLQLLLAALLSVVALESGLIGWLSLAGAGLDLTGHFFILALAPVVAVVAMAVGLIFSRLFSASPKLHGTVYLVLWAALHAALLATMKTPIAEIGWYADTIVLVGGLVLVVLYFFRWRSPVETPPATLPPVGQRPDSR